MAEKTMGDVDRLFACFKCGISPPQSAVRADKRVRRNERRRGHSTERMARGLDLNEEEEDKATTSGFSDDNKYVAGDMSSIRRRKNHVSPVVFYGSPLGIPPKKPVSLLRLLREIRADIAEHEKPITASREEIWATFPRQNEAMNFAKEHGGNVRLFCYQDHHNGQRRFLVSTYKEFWRRYKIMDPKCRHHYEVLQEGLPCHLYFDLEFNKIENPEKDGDEMVDILVSVVFEVMQEKYNIQGSHDWVMELDSSTSEKFSRHLIVRVPNTAFKDNSHVGAFVTEVSFRISSLKEKNQALENLFIKKDSGACGLRSHIFIDNAVYTRNRCFRLALSSKAGKASVLLPTWRFKRRKMGEEEMFMETLICGVDNDCNKLLVCKMELDCMKQLHFDTEENCDIKRFNQPPSLNHIPNDAVSVSSSTGKSPFPVMDNFVESIASNESTPGKIRSWYWFSEHGLIVYSMARNRFCERIGREHKSNHVIYVADLRRGTYYQKCHDPDCQGYRSPLRPIPLHMWHDLSISDDSLTRGNPNYQLGDEERRAYLTYDDEHAPPSSGKESWWLEAIKVAESMENKDKAHLDNHLDVDEEDDGWWMAVESSLSHILCK